MSTNTNTRALDVAASLRRQHKDDAPNYDTMLDAAELLEALAARQPQPVFWYRPVGQDGGYEGPVHHASIEREESDGWVPLLPGAAPQPVSRIPFAGFDPNFCPGSNPENPQTEEGTQPSKQTQLAVVPGDVLIGVVELAQEAHAHWDADRTMKVGKILLALAGYSPRYDPRADALHAVLAARPQEGATP